MYDRAQMKLAAKARLQRGGRWLAVLVALIAAALGGGVSIQTPSLEFNQSFSPSDTQSPPSFGSEALFDNVLPYIFIGFIVLFIIVSILAFAYTTFLGNVVKVGTYGWFMRYAREEEPPVQHVFLGFRIYGKAVVTMLLHDVYVLLWSLLFVIPGIIKGIGYSLTPYILYENPKLSPKEALNLSAKMMNGWKMEAFELHLSFIGWRLLSVLTFGVLDVLYVNPYFETAYAMFYDTVRYDALYVRQIVTPEELNVELPETTVPADDTASADAPLEDAALPMTASAEESEAPIAPEAPLPAFAEDAPTALPSDTADGQEQTED